MSRRTGLVVAACLWMLSAGWVLLHAGGVQGAPPPPATAAAPAPHGDALARYCLACHNGQVRMAGFVLDSVDLSSPSMHEAEVWEKVVRKLRTRAMPPQGMPRPADEVYVALTAWIEDSLDREAEAAGPNPGRSLLRRMNRTEYGNAIRDLLDMRVDVAALLPPDDAAFGFDNVSDMLSISPALLERYVVAADRVSALAVGAAVESGSDTYRVRQDRSQDQHIDGLPLGTVGGLGVTHWFPVDGEYELAVTLYRTNLSAIRGLEYPHQIEISIDGEPVFHEVVGTEADRTLPGTITDRSDAIDARLRVRVPVKAGPRQVAAAFVRKVGASPQRLQPFLRSSAGTYDSTGRPHIETLTISGPFTITGPGETPSRQRIFTCVPATAADEERCAMSILDTLARRAFRRPLTDTDRDRLLTFYQAGHARGGFAAGVQMGLRRILASPAFVFRIEDEPGHVPPGAAYRVTDLDLASRLSFFLWSSIPDDELLDTALAGRLSDPAELEQQVRRMLADPRSEALMRHFAGQWLHVRNLRNKQPNSEEFPDFDDTLREAFQHELELFFGSIVNEDRSVVDLLTADHTFVNERLARHYGIPHVYGSHFRRVTLDDDTRRGILGKGGLLMVTSHADRTAPVLRGKWILENVFGTPPLPPPPDAETTLAEPSGQEPTTLRARLEMHRANPQCASCHQAMDPLGFALEHFDAVGGQRTHENGRPIDASGLLADGTPVDGVVALRQALVSRADLFVTTFTERLMLYALGRGLQPSDMPAVRRIVREAEYRDYRFSAIVLGIVQSTPFQMRMKAPGAGPLERDLVAAADATAARAATPGVPMERMQP